MKANDALRRLIWAGVFAANVAGASSQTDFDGYARATDAELDQMRGGFEISLNGLPFLVAFSLERLTYVNGELVASMQLNLDSIRQAISQGVAPMIPDNPTNPAPTSGSSASSEMPGTSFEMPPSSVPVVPTSPPAIDPSMSLQAGVATLIQNGVSRSLVAPESLGALTTVIQNTLDNQLIQNLTVVNARFSQADLELAARMNLLSSQLLGR